MGAFRLQLQDALPAEQSNIQINHQQNLLSESGATLWFFSQLTLKIRAFKIIPPLK